MKRKKRIIFFSHAVTMAHFTRPFKWLQSLDYDKFEIYFATDPSFRKYLTTYPVTFVAISCIDAKIFADRVGAAKPIYDAATFESHIAEDTLILESLKPDLVIGDFRHSLSVSCRLQKIKYINITNAYWSPDIQMSFPMPEAPIVRRLGLSLAGLLIRPVLFIPLKINFFKMAYILRKSLKKANLFFLDYRKLITDGDLAVFCDTPGLVPLKKVHQHELFVGPLLWSVASPIPCWWKDLDLKKKKIFLSLGSSGNIEILPKILQALSRVPAEVIVASAGRSISVTGFSHIHVTDFLPLEEVCQHVDLVICNGGSPVSHFALKYGVPVLGIVGNNDQLLNMAHLSEKGAAKVLRFWSLSQKKIFNTVTEILENPIYKERAMDVKNEFDRFDFEKQSRLIVEQNLLEV